MDTAENVHLESLVTRDFLFLFVLQVKWLTKANIGTRPTAVFVVTRAGHRCWAGRSFLDEDSSSAQSDAAKANRPLPVARPIRMPTRPLISTHPHPQQDRCLDITTRSGYRSVLPLQPLHLYHRSLRHAAVREGHDPIAGLANINSRHSSNSNNNNKRSSTIQIDGVIETVCLIPITIFNELSHPGVGCFLLFTVGVSMSVKSHEYFMAVSMW